MKNTARHFYVFLDNTRYLVAPSSDDFLPPHPFPAPPPLVFFIIAVYIMLTA